jgi:hypothetical protein
VVAHAAPRWSRRGQRPFARQPVLGVRCVRSTDDLLPEPAPSAAETRPPLPDDAIAKYTAIWLEHVRRKSGWKPAQLEKYVSVASASWLGRDRVELELTVRVAAGWFVLDGLKLTLPVSLDCASRSSAAPCDTWLESADYATLESEGASIGRRFKLAPLAFPSETAGIAAIRRRFGPPGTDAARGLDEDGRPWLCALVRDPDFPDGGTIGGVNLVTRKTERCIGVEIPGKLPWSP